MIGGTGTIGAACAQALVEREHSVVVASRSFKDVKSSPEEADLEARLAVDITDPVSVSALAQHITTHFLPLDVVILTAGGAEAEPLHCGADHAAERLARITRMTAVHVGGTVLVGSAFLPLLALRRGIFIVITSRAASRHDPRVLSYAAAKAAQEHAVATFAGEWAQHGIDVFCVAPGKVSGPLLRALAPDAGGTALRPADVADAVCDLIATRPGTGTKITLRARHLPEREQLLADRCEGGRG
ncbi:SDR family oxidoreductase [Nonomuraea sp. NPDC049129]|uniref:SDR family NAD(P)-dependent oxidoreductase n=1 Tax=Nonomuraea sp. NPDC049129 TaxID=3155272 RepID=UPI0033ED5EE8